jgi:MFS transporter, MHS family, shikimate and dehydroshikimate transport protein
VGDFGERPPAVTAAMLRRVAVASCIGSTVEWYDFFIYATASALVFNKLFFPSLDPLVGSLLALGTYAVGFFVTILSVLGLPETAPRRTA